MVEKRQVYKCMVCGNIVEVLFAGGGTLVCCGDDMHLMKENSVDASKEKHVPIIQGNEVLVGSVAHPMEEAHYIEWIEASDGKNYDKVFLKPGQKPEAEFCFKPISAREFCNLHGLWKN